MEWWLALTVILGGFLLLMIIGMPVAFCFLLVNLIAAYFLWGGDRSFHILTLGFVSSITNFNMLPLPLFILMGGVMFDGGLAPAVLDAVDRWIGRIPGRLGLVAVGAGTLFATFTGVSMASCAMLGMSLVPEMKKRGYKTSMTLGPILGSAGLAIMIPPSSTAVLLGVIGQVSIGRLLLAIVIPGLLMAVFYAAYIMVRCMLQPSIAPAYDVPPTPLREKLNLTVVHILPLAIIIFLVVGVVFLGIATPSEAAATGALGCFLLTAAHKRLTWKVIEKSFRSTVRIVGMVFIIVVGAIAFSQILAFSGASAGLVKFVTGFSTHPIIILVGILIAGTILGMFMTMGAVTMVLVPLAMPIVRGVGLDPIWFATIFLLILEMSTTTPPYGINLFVMQEVGPPGTTFADCVRAALPFLACDATVVVLIILFPQLALWLPSMMR